MWVGTAECAERSAAHRRWRRVLNSQSKSWPNIYQAQIAQPQKLRPRYPDLPPLYLSPGPPHIPPGRPKISGRPPADALFFDLLPYQDAFQNLFQKNYEKNAKIEDFGFPNPS